MKNIHVQAEPFLGASSPVGGRDLRMWSPWRRWGRPAPTRWATSSWCAQPASAPYRDSRARRPRRRQRSRARPPQRARAPRADAARPAAVGAPRWPAPGRRPPPGTRAPSGPAPPSAEPAPPQGWRGPRAPAPSTPWTPLLPATSPRMDWPSHCLAKCTN